MRVLYQVNPVHCLCTCSGEGIDYNVVKTRNASDCRIDIVLDTARRHIVVGVCGRGCVNAFVLDKT